MTKPIRTGRPISINLCQEEKLTEAVAVLVPPREPQKTPEPLSSPRHCDCIDVGVAWALESVRGLQEILCADKFGNRQFRRQ